MSALGSGGDLTRLTMGIRRNDAAFIGRDHYERVSELSMPVKFLHGTAV
ncbi:MAG TPA: hypothetical protein VJB57_05615 [Dehalococcoidia bacterium]|nr:hypothetical protein [Dehalococcoidia bacterium]